MKLQSYTEQPILPLFMHGFSFNSVSFFSFLFYKNKHFNFVTSQTFSFLIRAEQTFTVSCWVQTGTLTIVLQQTNSSSLLGICVCLASSTHLKYSSCSSGWWTFKCQIKFVVPDVLTVILLQLTFCPFADITARNLSILFTDFVK